MRWRSADSKHREVCSAWSISSPVRRDRDGKPARDPTSRMSVYRRTRAGQIDSKRAHDAVAIDVAAKTPPDFVEFFGSRFPSPTRQAPRSLPRPPGGPRGHPPSGQRSSGKRGNSRKPQPAPRRCLPPCSAEAWHSPPRRSWDTESAGTPTPSCRTSTPESAFRRRLPDAAPQPEAWLRIPHKSFPTILSKSRLKSLQDVQRAAATERAQKTHTDSHPGRQPPGNR